MQETTILQTPPQLSLTQDAVLATPEQDIRLDVVDRIFRNLVADAERSEGELLRVDIDRVYLRRNLTILECGIVETRLSETEIRIVEDDDEEDQPLDKEPSRAKAKYLTDVEERELGRKIQLARRMQDAAAGAASEFVNRLVAEAEAAKATFVESNIRYVHKLVRQRRYLRHLTPEDLAQEGMMGLLRAAELFDPELGFRFKTYATWWVQQHINRALDDGDRTIRLPVHLHESIRKLKRKRTKLAIELGREPSVAELADKLGIEKERLSKILWNVQITDCTEADAPISEDGLTLLSLKSDDDASTAFEIVVQQELRNKFRSVLASLSAREERIIRMRFGLDGNDELTLEAIGQKFGVTRERIRQIEAKALRRLKHPSRSRHLSSFLD